MILRAVLLCLGVGLSGLVWATEPAKGPTNERAWEDDNLSYDQARRAVTRGEVMSLSEVIEYLRRYSNGDIVATEYEYEFERWVYEFKLIDAQGRMSKVHIDARDGSLVQVADD